MTRTQVSRIVNAPIGVVFNTVADINQFSKAIPHIVKVEILSDVRSGVGTKFRETRLMKGREAATDLEVTEFAQNEHVRLVADSHGTIWDSVFAVKSIAGGTELTLTMDAKSDKLIPKIMNRLIYGMVKKALERDMDSVKEYCEKEKTK